MLLRLLRVIIGLPFVFFAWPFIFVICFFILGISHGMCAIRWICTGAYLPEYDLDAQDHEDTCKAFMHTLTLPYQFINKVLKG